MRKFNANFEAAATTKGQGSAPIGKPAPLQDAPVQDSPALSDEELAAEFEAEAKNQRMEEYANSLDIVMGAGRANTHVVRKNVIVVNDPNSVFFGKKRCIINLGIRSWTDAECGRINASFGYPMEAAGRVTDEMVISFHNRFGGFNAGDSCEVEFDDKGFVKTIRPIAMAAVMAGTRSAAAATAAPARQAKYIVQDGFIIETETGASVMPTTASNGTTFNVLPRVAPKRIAVSTQFDENDLPF
jgi:hypothetical protein